MNQYISFLDPIPWQAVAISAGQAFVLYWFVLIGIRLVGRRVFGELGPQDLIILLIISEASSLGVTHQEAGFWGTLASILTILITGFVVERIPLFHKVAEPGSVVIFQHGKPDQEQMKRYMIQKEDLEKTARKYGLPGVNCCETMILEGDGEITAVIKPEYLLQIKQAEPPTVG